MRRWVGILTALIVLVPVIAVAAPPIGGELQAWMNQTDARLDSLEARVEALENSSTTTTVPTTTSTSAASTSTTTAPSTTTTTAGNGPGAHGYRTAPPTGLTQRGPMSVSGQTNIVIEGFHFIGNGTSSCIGGFGGSNITIRNNRFTNCHKAVYLQTMSNVTVADNWFEADAGPQGRNSVQFNNTSGQILRNYSTRPLGTSNLEDHINLYNSHGTATNPILVENNYLIGGGVSGSGSCIVLGDVHGDYQIVRNNTCVNGGQLGIGISGGSHNQIIDNVIYSRQFAWSNLGVVVWEYTGNSGPCTDHVVSGNLIDFTNAQGQENDIWFPTGGSTACTNVVFSNNDTNVDLSYLEP